MKTAISVPDLIFERADRCAKELGMSRSHFYATAVERYLQELDKQDLTRRLDEAIAVSGQDSDDIVHASKRFLADVEW